MFTYTDQSIDSHTIVCTSLQSQDLAQISGTLFTLNNYLRLRGLKFHPCVRHKVKCRTWVKVESKVTRSDTDAQKCTGWTMNFCTLLHEMRSKSSEGQRHRTQACGYPVMVIWRSQTQNTSMWISCQGHLKVTCTEHKHVDILLRSSEGLSCTRTQACRYPVKVIWRSQAINIACRYPVKDYLIRPTSWIWIHSILSLLPQTGSLINVKTDRLTRRRRR